MARIAGINLPINKHLNIGLTKIFGIGRNLAIKICLDCNIDPSIKIKNLKDDEIEKIRQIIATYKIEGDLRREISTNIKRLSDLSCYRGIRHRKKLPLRGQKTKTNARTRKGPRKGKTK